MKKFIFSTREDLPALKGDEAYETYGRKGYHNLSLFKAERKNILELRGFVARASAPDRNCAQILRRRILSIIDSTEDSSQLEKLDALVAPFASEPAYCRRVTNGFLVVYKLPDHSLLHVFCDGSDVVNIYTSELGEYEHMLDNPLIRWIRPQHVTNQLSEADYGRPQ